MERFEQYERSLDRCGTRISELRPFVFRVRFYGGNRFSERQLEAHVGVHVAVRQVMNQLPHCPPAVPVGSIELRFAQSLHCGAKLCGGFRNLMDCFLPQRGRDACGHCKISDGVTRVHRISWREDWKERE